MPSRHWKACFAWPECVGIGTRTKSEKERKKANKRAKEECMISERMLSAVVRTCAGGYLKLSPTTQTHLPKPAPDKKYMLYMHVPFCERLCPYCSFNRFPFTPERAVPYFKNMRQEMHMLKNLGYDFESVYIGGGTPTIMIDQLCETIDEARNLFPSIKEVSSETNPNHLIPEYVEKLTGRVQRLSVGVQSFNNGLLKQMDRFQKYGSGTEILERIQYASPYFVSMNADMIFNFPAQTPDILISDIESVVKSGASQATFYPLMASPSVEKSLANTVGKVDYRREKQFYDIICTLLTEGVHAPFEFGSAWTFNRKQTAGSGNNNANSSNGNGGNGIGSSVNGVNNNSSSASNAIGAGTNNANSTRAMIDEYVVNYEEYPAIGSGGITYLDGKLYVNTFSVNDYNKAIEQGTMSIMGQTTFSLRDRMRYRFMMQLFGLRLDKKAFKRDFGTSVEAGLPAEMAFMCANGAFATNTESELTLTSKGRYLTVAMMRQFFIGVNGLRDQARAALQGEERTLIFGE